MIEVYSPKSFRNDWLFHRNIELHVDRYANSTATIESDQAERDVVEWFRNRRGRPMLTEWSDLADPLELAGIHDWGVRARRQRVGVGGAEPS